MKTEILREFVVFAKRLNFSAAAKDLFVTQPTLSTHIMALERELGFKLVDRKGEIRLTEAGVIFLEGAVLALSAIDSALDRCKSALGQSGTVRIASSPPSPELAAALCSVRDIPFSCVDIDFHAPFFSVFINDEADIMFHNDFSMSPGVVAEAESLGLEYRRIGVFNNSILMMKSNPLASRENLTREDLRGAHFTINSAPDYERMKTLITDMLGDDLDLKFHLRAIGSLNDLTFFDYGDTLFVLEKTLMERYLGARTDVRLIDAVDEKPLTMPFVIVYRKEPSNPNVTRFLEEFLVRWEARSGR